MPSPVDPNCATTSSAPHSLPSIHQPPASNHQPSLHSPFPNIPNALAHLQNISTNLLVITNLLFKPNASSTDNKSQTSHPMAEFAELGLEAADHLLENYDIPDQFWHPRKALNSIRHRKKEQGSKFPVLDRLEGRKAEPAQETSVEKRASSRRNSTARSDNSEEDQEGHYSDGIYSAPRSPSAPQTQSQSQSQSQSHSHSRSRSRRTSRTDPFWEEAQQRTEAAYVSPEPLPLRNPKYPARNRDPEAPYRVRAPPPQPYMANWNPNYRDAPAYAPDARTDFPPPYAEGEQYRTYEPPQLRRSSSTLERNKRERARERGEGRPGLKKRSSSTGPSSGLGDAFSTSDKGLGAGGLGALAGGFVAQELSKGSRKGDPLLLTLLGAAVGGIGGNLLEGRLERRRKLEEEEEGRRRRKSVSGKEGESRRRRRSVAEKERR